MPEPIAICIENLDTKSERSRYLRCVAVPGRGPGLRVSSTGAVIWRREDGVAFELWVSADDRLILYRPEGAPPTMVSRSGRTLEVPFSKPVVLVDQDEMTVGARHLRVHIHGMAAAVTAPAPLAPQRGKAALQKGLAAAAMLGTMALAAGCKDIEVRTNPPVPLPPSTPTLEVRETPPAPEIPTETPTPTIEVRENPPTATPLPVSEEFQVESVVQGPWLVAQAYEIEGEEAWIQGALTLTGESYTFQPAQEAPGPSIGGALDFLFAAPTGKATVTLDVYFEADYRNFAEGTVLATVSFEGSPTVYEVRVAEAGTLQIMDPAGGSDVWSITRQP